MPPAPPTCVSVLRKVWLGHGEKNRTSPCMAISGLVSRFDLMVWPQPGKQHLLPSAGRWFMAREVSVIGLDIGKRLVLLVFPSRQPMNESPTIDAWTCIPVLDARM